MSSSCESLPLWSVWLSKKCRTCQWPILAIQPPRIYTTSDCWHPALCSRRSATTIQTDIHCGQLFPGRAPLSVQDTWGRSVLSKQSIWQYKSNPFLRTSNNFSTTSSSVPSTKVFSESTSHSGEKLLFSTLLQQQWNQQLGSLLRNHVGLRVAYGCEYFAIFSMYYFKIPTFQGACHVLLLLKFVWYSLKYGLSQAIDNWWDCESSGSAFTKWDIYGRWC